MHNTNKKKPANNKKKNNFSKLISTLAHIKEVGSGTLVFKMYDGSILSTPFNLELLKDENRRARTVGSIVQILNSIKHDYGAKYWVLN